MFKNLALIALFACAAVDAGKVQKYGKAMGYGKKGHYAPPHPVYTPGETDIIYPEATTEVIYETPLYVTEIVPATDAYVVPSPTASYVVPPIHVYVSTTSCTTHAKVVTGNISDL